MGIKKTFLLLTTAIGALLAFNPSASAQDVSEFSNAAPANMRPGIRYTTGAVTTSGWEKSLTDNNPNLKKWNWSAMTSYTQSCYGKVPAGAYLKKSNKPEEVALRPAGSIYTKPIQVSADAFAKKRPTPGVIVVGNSNSNSNVSGRIRAAKPQIAEAAPVAKSYNSYSDVSGRITAPEGQNLASRNVYGRLMRTQ